MIISKYVLAPMIAHGITDIIDKPMKTLMVYSICSPILNNLNCPMQFTLLMGSSIYHMRKDVPFEIYGSIILHGLWLYEPIIAPYFLTYIHTPRHYLRTLKTKSILKIPLVLSMCYVVLYGIQHNWIHFFQLHFGSLWWSIFVICHIIVHDT